MDGLREALPNTGLNQGPIPIPEQGPPTWLQQLLESQQNAIHTQQQEMLRVIQQQGERIDQLATYIAQNTPNTTTPTPPPTLANPNITSIDAIAKRPHPKLPDPEKFTGEDLSLFPQFEGKLQAKLEIDAIAIGEEKDRIWYGFSRLEGRAAARIFPWMSTYKGTSNFTLTKFFDQLKIAFQDPAFQDKALTRLNTLRQGNRSFNDLISELDRLLLEAGGHAWDDKVKKGYLRAAVNQTLRDKLITIEEKPSYEEYCLQVKNIADRLAEFKRISTPRSNVGTAPISPGTMVQPMGKAIIGDTMDWEPSTSRQSRRAKWVTREELDHRRQDGRCLRCGSSEHHVKTCPYLPPQRPQIQQGIRNNTEGHQRNQNNLNRPKASKVKAKTPELDTSSEDSGEEVFHDPIPSGKA